MEYFDYINKLSDTVRGLPQRILAVFGSDDLVMMIRDIGASHDLPMRDIGALCEVVRKIITGETEPTNFEAILKEMLSEDGAEKMREVAIDVNERVLTKLLPALGKKTITISALAIPSQPYTPVPSEDRRGGEIASSSLPATPSSRAELATGQASYQLPATPMDERHLRALLRIAAGTTYTEERLREAFEDLPEGLKRAIVSVDTANAVQEIAKKFLLHIDQMAALASETGLVLLGLTHPKDFVKNLAGRLRVSEQRALEIAREVSGQILVKVREALRELHAGEEARDEKRETRPDIGLKKRGMLAAQEEPPRAAPFSSEGGSALGGGKGRTTPASEDGGTPFGKGELPRVQTPYSAEAKWKTEDEQPTREEVLRDIEQPTKTQPTTNNQRPTTEQKEMVGPTGWRPPAGQPTRPTSSERSSVGHAADNQRPTTQTTAPNPSLPRQQAGLEKEGGQRDKDFIDQKLSGPMGQRAETRRYTIDPYREQIE